MSKVGRKSRLQGKVEAEVLGLLRKENEDAASCYIPVTRKSFRISPSSGTEAGDVGGGVRGRPAGLLAPEGRLRGSGCGEAVRGDLHFRWSARLRRGSWPICRPTCLEEPSEAGRDPAGRWRLSVAFGGAGRSHVDAVCGAA